MDGKGVGLCLKFPDGGLYLLELDVGVMIKLDVGGQAPVFEGVCCLNKEVEGGLVGHHALDEPEGEDIGGGGGSETMEGRAWSSWV